MPAKKLSISIPGELYKEAVKRQKLFGYEKFSEYVAACIRAEVQSRATEHIRTLVGLPSAAYTLNETPVSTKRRGIHQKEEN